MPLPSRQGLVHAGAICMGMKLGRKGNAEGIRYYLLLPVAREQQQPPSLYNSGTWLLLERKVSKQLANCNSHCLLAIIRRTVINSNRWNSNGSVSLFFSIPKGICYELNYRFWAASPVSKRAEGVPADRRPRLRRCWAPTFLRLCSPAVDLPRARRHWFGGACLLWTFPNGISSRLESSTNCSVVSFIYSAVVVFV